MANVFKRWSMVAPTRYELRFHGLTNCMVSELSHVLRLTRRIAMFLLLMIKDVPSTPLTSCPISSTTTSWDTRTPHSTPCSGSRKIRSFISNATLRSVKVLVLTQYAASRSTIK
uniref:Uncharacterized protein n=1 Tax=Cacopsylla melanoneura TaxID=428564 RepID=A0A8D8TL96_9HEMI